MNVKEFNRNHALRVMNWCKRNVGVNYRRKYMPVLEWHNKSEDGDCGDYDFEDNIISVYKSAHTSAIDIIHTIIHEWAHYLQSTKKYYEYSDTYTYDKNPFELQANYIADKYKFQCKRELFRK
jgi:Zn-dependent peptidase ImmA (M78 family)